MKFVENRSGKPVERKGRCAISVSKGFSSGEYARFIAWANETFGVWWCVNNLWDWNEGYPNWWLLSNVRRLPTPVPCRGNVGMWPLPEVLSALVSKEEWNYKF